MKVRDNPPKRRKNPTNNPTGSNWSEHKSDLREDFHKHCGYCGSYDGFSHTYFEVDHFVPKSVFKRIGKIELCQYDNLVYSCKFCNNIKSSKWPSNDETIAYINDEGFIEPCSSEYDTHLYRTNSGSIRWLTKLGKWMVEVGFKFDERDYAIKLLWELNQLRNAIDSLILEAKKYNINSNERITILEKVNKYTTDYYLYHNELMDYYKTM